VITVKKANMVNIKCASSRGIYLNSGNGVKIQPIDIGHAQYLGLVSADTAFWALVKKEQLSHALTKSSFLKAYRRKEKYFVKELDTLRFGRKPFAVYFNPTDRCNLNCSYCYIPEKMRKYGRNMPAARLLGALKILKGYFQQELPKNIKPQIIFHGAEPLLNKEAVLGAIHRFADDFQFGIQTNGTLLDPDTIDFLVSKNISIGLSLDGHRETVAGRLRKTWNGQGIFSEVVKAIRLLKGYANYSVICTVTRENMFYLADIVEFLHSEEVSVCMLNPLRCTLPGSRPHKPQDHHFAAHYLKALDHSFELYKKSGRRIIIANFANILISILAPSARRLMCDISPCGGGRRFFAVSASGDAFACSEFIGLNEFKGGNIFKDKINKILDSEPFRLVTGRKVENIQPCFNCAIRHFCGSPCPAEAYQMNGSMEKPGAFCELYEEQIRFAMRLIADAKEEAFLWDGWDKGTAVSLEITKL